jgi:phage pi2 protein 07
MNVITLESEVYQEILNHFIEIKGMIDLKKKQSPLNETYLDISDTCQLLKISKRLLQQYRNDGVLNFSQIGGKIYFRASDINELLDSHYVDSKRKR